MVFIPVVDGLTGSILNERLGTASRSVRGTAGGIRCMTSSGIRRFGMSVICTAWSHHGCRADTHGRSRPVFTKRWRFFNDVKEIRTEFLRPRFTFIYQKINTTSTYNGTWSRVTSIYFLSSRALCMWFILMFVSICTCSKFLSGILYLFLVFLT
jgi:hypothetical protein